MNNEIQQQETKTNDGFIFYSSFYEAIQQFSAKKRLQAYDVLCHYGIKNELPDLDDPDLSKDIKIFIKMAIPQINANIKKYRQKVENGMKGKDSGMLGAEHGKKGGRPRTDFLKSDQKWAEKFEEELGNVEFMIDE